MEISSSMKIEGASFLKAMHSHKVHCLPKGGFRVNGLSVSSLLYGEFAMLVKQNWDVLQMKLAKRSHICCSGDYTDPPLNF